MSAGQHPLFLTDGDGSLGGRAIKGALAAGGSQAIKVAVQFISVAILARLLTPHDFGLVAMITPIVGFSLLFQDFGLTQAVVTSRQLTQPEAARIFFMNLWLSIAVALCVVASAPFLGIFYHEPAVVALTVGSAVPIVISGASSAHQALLTRAMRFNVLAVIDVARTVTVLLVAVIVAYLFASPWALVLSNIGGSIITLILTWALAGWRPSQPSRSRAVSSMLNFGKNMTLFNVSNYLSRNADNVLIGWARGPLELGFYDRAYKLLLFPLQQINAPLSGVMMPVLSRLAGDPDRYRAAYERTLRITMLATVPGTLTLIVTAPVLIPSLLGARWAPSVVIFQWLGLAGVHQTISSTFGWLFISQQRAHEYARFGLFSAATCLLAFAIGIHWGATGVAAAYGLSGLVLRLPVIIWVVGRQGPVTHSDIVRLALPYAIAAAVTALAGFVVFPLFRLSPILHLISATLFTFGLYTVFMACSRGGREAFSELLGILKISAART